MKDDLSSEAQFGGSVGPSQETEPTKNEPREPTSADMSRSLQTIWIVSVIAVIGLGILYSLTRLPDNHPWKECEQIIGMDGACKARIARRELMRAY